MELNRLLLTSVMKWFLSNDEQLNKVVYNWRYSHITVAFSKLAFFHYWLFQIITLILLSVIIVGLHCYEVRIIMMEERGERSLLSNWKMITKTKQYSGIKTIFIDIFFIAALFHIMIEHEWLGPDKAFFPSSFDGSW